MKAYVNSGYTTGECSVPGGGQERGGVDSHYISLTAQHRAVTVHQKGPRSQP